MNVLIDKTIPFLAKSFLNKAYSGSTQASSQADSHVSGSAYMNHISETGIQIAMENNSDAPLSDAELEQLFSVYTVLGDEHPLWQDIGRLLTEFSGQDRTNFLSVISRQNEHLENLVYQVALMEDKTQTLYLKSAVRLDPETGIPALIEAVEHMPENLLVPFLETADTLGRTSESLKALELQNFMTAAANDPLSAGSLTEMTQSLEEDDRAMFLKAAAVSGKHLDRLISRVEALSGNRLTSFLSVASNAGNQMETLLDLTEKMTRHQQQKTIRFLEKLEETDVQYFLKATQGDTILANMLLDTAGPLSDRNQSLFLKAAASSGSQLVRLSGLVERFSSDGTLLEDFLMTATVAEKNLGSFLDVSENLTKENRQTIFSFTSDLSAADLASYISAVKDAPESALALATAAGSSGKMNQSYLLYAASLTPDQIPDLLDAADNMEGGELSDFLFIAANIDPENKNTAMKQLIHATQDLSESALGAYLSAEKSRILTQAEKPEEKTFVFLESAFSDQQIDILLTAGTDIHELLSDLKELGSSQKNTFFNLAQKAGGFMIPKLISVLTRTTQQQTVQFQDYADTLSPKMLNDLIAAADLALDNPESGEKRFDRLLSTAKKLGLAMDEDFLHAAARSGKHLDQLMDQTNKFGGLNQAFYLIAADSIVDRDSSGMLLKTFLDATQTVYDQNKTAFLAANDTPQGIRPSRFINAEAGTINFLFQKDNMTAKLSDYLRSAAWLATNTGADNATAYDWCNSFLGIPAQGEVIF